MPETEIKPYQKVMEGFKQVALEEFKKGIHPNKIASDLGIKTWQVYAWAKEEGVKRFKPGRLTDIPETPAQEKERLAIEARVGHTHGKEKGIKFLADSSVDPATRYGVDRHLEEEANRLLRGEK
jgi:hypothetical protein